MSELLGPDGRIDFEGGFSGSVDPTGYRMTRGPGGEPRFVPVGQTAGVVAMSGSPDDNWDDRFAHPAPGVVGESAPESVNAIALTPSGDVIVAGGLNGAVDASGEIPASSIALWDGSIWSALGTGTSGTVYALAVSGGDVYAGGDFITAGGVTVNHVARWDGSAWSALGTGMDYTVNALAISGGDVFAGGAFTTAGGVTVNRVARWDGSSWSALGTGMDDTVNALEVIGSDLYAGGEFTAAGGVPATSIARWNGTAWSALAAGWGSEAVLSLEVSGSDLIVGGAASNVGRWDGSAWTFMPMPWGPLGPRPVRAISEIGSELFAATQSSPDPEDDINLGRWDGVAWSFSSDTQVYGRVKALAVGGSELYVGGTFTRAGRLGGGDYAALASNIAVLESGSWSALGVPGQGTERKVEVLLGYGTDLYAGGSFSAAGAAAATGFGRWDGSVWTSLEVQNVHSMALLGGDLYVGHDAGVDRWDGASWTQVGVTTGGVYSLMTLGSDLYASGLFTSISGVSASYIARWDGSTWSALGSGLDFAAIAMSAMGSDLVVAGQFDSAGGAPANGIARWDGSAWFALGSGPLGTVAALAEGDGVLFAGGDFSTIGGVAANHLAQWDGSTWSAVGTGMDGPVRALLMSGSDLIVGGDFTTAGGASANGIAVWNGFGWFTFGSGIDIGLGGGGLDGVDALLVADGALWVGGSFAAAGGKPSANIALWAPVCGDGVIDVPEKCDDGNVLDGDCCSSTCQIEPDGSPCDDGTECIIGETCQLGSCEGTAIGCVDSNECTWDYCDPAIGCVSPPKDDGTPCDDSDVCTTEDTCQAGFCVGADPLDCDDVDDCTAESCDEVTGCASVPVAGCVAPVALVDGGDLLLADADRDALLRLDPASGDRSIASAASTGSGPAPTGATAVAVDPATVALWLGTSVGTLLRVDPVSGDRVEVASDTTGSGPSLSTIQDLALEASGDVLVANDATPAMPLRVDPLTGDRALISADCCFDHLPSVAVEADGNILVGSVAGVTQSSIIRVDATTGATSLVSSSPFSVGTGPILNGPWDMEVEPDGSILALGADALLRVDSVTGNRTLLSGRGTGSGPDFQDARGLVRASDTDAYVSDQQADRVVHVDLVSGARTVVSDATTGQGTTLTGPAHLVAVVDGDADGVSDLVEHAAPNGGDGNADGTPDAEQMDVASLPDGEGVDMLTVEVGGGCAELLDVAASKESDLAFDDLLYDYPLGLVSFRLPCSSADVTLLFHGASSLSPPYRKLGPTIPGDPGSIDWYNLPGASFASVDVGGQTVAEVSFSLADGVLGDDTGVDAEIVDVGGPPAADVKASLQSVIATLELDPLDPSLPPITASGTGVAPVRGGFGGEPLTAFSLPEGVLATTNQPGYTTSGTAWYATLSNAAGAFQRTASGEFAGVMPIRGTLRICLLTGCGFGLLLPLTENETAGIGIGGPPIARGTASVAFTLQGAPWTGGTVTASTPTTAPPTAGLLHGPLSTTTPSWMSLTSGVVQLVTPILVTSNVQGPIPSYGRLTLHFVPEPSKLAMLVAGVVFLLAVGRSRMRR